MFTCPCVMSIIFHLPPLCNLLKLLVYFVKVGLIKPVSWIHILFNWRPINLPCLKDYCHRVCLKVFSFCFLGSILMMRFWIYSCLRIYLLSSHMDGNSTKNRYRYGYRYKYLEQHINFKNWYCCWFVFWYLAWEKFMAGLNFCPFVSNTFYFCRDFQVLFLSFEIKNYIHWMFSFIFFLVLVDPFLSACKGFSSV